MALTNQSRTDPRRRDPAAAAPIDPESFGLPEARHLLWRAGFGGSEQQVRELSALGPEGAVDSLLNFEETPMEPDGPSQFDHTIMRPLSTEERRALNRARQSQDENTLARFRSRRQTAQRADRKQIREIQKWWLSRMIQTRRPLEEKLTLFWHGHFASSYRSVEDSYHMYSQNRLFRKEAAGNFGNLLTGIIRDPAMLRYLNNNNSFADSPNENLARELMELFSLGEGNYTERDIKEGARALTGYSFNDDSFVFREDRHDQGAKRILGARGRLDGDDFARAILSREACSEFIAARIYRFFTGTGPMQPRDLVGSDKVVVEKLASTMRRSRYDIKPVLRQLLLSRRFYDPSIRNSRIKSPAELIVGAVRSLGAPTRDLNVLLSAMDQMGQSLMAPPSVKGWDGGRAWINPGTMFVRQNTLAYLITGASPRSRFPRATRNDHDPRSVLPFLFDPSSETSSETVAQRLLDVTLGTRDDTVVGALAGIADKRGGPDKPGALADMLLLITALPEYQLC